MVINVVDAGKEEERFLNTEDVLPQKIGDQEKVILEGVQETINEINKEKKEMKEAREDEKWRQHLHKHTTFWTHPKKEEKSLMERMEEAIETMRRRDIIPKENALELEIENEIPPPKETNVEKLIREAVMQQEQQIYSLIADPEKTRNMRVKMIPTDPKKLKEKYLDQTTNGRSLMTTITDAPKLLQSLKQGMKSVSKAVLELVVTWFRLR